MYGGVPRTRPVAVIVRLSATREMPKPMTRGPSDGPRPHGEAEQDGHQQGDDGRRRRERASGQARFGGG